ncbi:MAG: hypothetical protein AB1779_10720 [Candidatus Thermoplasmatota archaeon]
MREVSRITGIVIGVLALVVTLLSFLFIFVYSGLTIDYKFLWSGIIALFFGLVFYLAHAMTEKPSLLISTGIIGSIGILFLYVSIWVSRAEPGQKIINIIFLSIIVIVILGLVWYMSSKSAEERERLLERKKM